MALPRTTTFFFVSTAQNICFSFWSYYPFHLHLFSLNRTTIYYPLLVMYKNIYLQGRQQKWINNQQYRTRSSFPSFKWVTVYTVNDVPGKDPWKDPRGGLTGVWGVFPGERCLGKTLQTPVNPLGGLSKGSLPETSLTVHRELSYFAISHLHIGL